MKKLNRYSEARGPQSLGENMTQGLNKKYGKPKELAPNINHKEGRDEFGKEQSISYGNNGDAE